MARADIGLEAELTALRKLAAEERQEVLAEALPTLSDPHAQMLASFKEITSLQLAKEASKSLPMELMFYLTMEGLREVASSPYHFSSLPKWLELETWLPKDGLLLLCGVCPRAALVDWSYENFMGAEIQEPKLRAATCLNDIHNKYDVPERRAWDEEVADLRRRLRAKENEPTSQGRDKLEEQLGRLLRCRDDPSIVRRAEELRLRSRLLALISRHWFSGEHDAEKRYPPEYFLGWASARGFKPEWYEWAIAQGLVDQHEDVFRQPFFDPDSDDYPELLHIAITAWQEARKGGEGTPKQRIDRFLKDRYPRIPTTTRNLISQLANWQRTGGRPRN